MLNRLMIIGITALLLFPTACSRQGRLSQYACLGLLSLAGGCLFLAGIGFRLFGPIMASNASLADAMLSFRDEPLPTPSLFKLVNRPMSSIGPWAMRCCGAASGAIACAVPGPGLGPTSPNGFAPRLKPGTSDYFTWAKQSRNNDTR